MTDLFLKPDRHYYTNRTKLGDNQPPILWMVFIALVLMLFSFIASRAHGQVNLLSQADTAAIKRILPTLDSEKFNRILRDPTVNWYDLKTMPPAFQFQPGNGYLPTYFFHANNNFSGDPSDAPYGNGNGGNANCEFPWAQNPGGANRSPSVDSFKGMWLPKQPNGRPLPVVWFRDSLPGRRGGGRVVRGGSPLPIGPSRNGNHEHGYRWIFPEGTVFIEALTTRDSKRYSYVFEIRFRIREIDDWGVELFRPFPTAVSMANGIKRLFPIWRKDAALSSAVAELTRPKAMQKIRLYDVRHTAKHAFDVTSGRDEIPLLSADKAENERRTNAMLTRTTFQTALGQVWRRGSNGVDCYAPTNSRKLHGIVPYNYDGTFMGSDRTSCMNCHDSANMHSTAFEVPRGWYGRVRGSDGILSWHPISPRSVSTNGAPIQVRFRQSYVNAGIIERFNVKRHPPKLYQAIKGLK